MKNIKITKTKTKNIKNQKNKKENSKIKNIEWLFNNVYYIYIIKNLLEKKENKFSILEKEIHGISTATLSKNLKKLEKEKIIKKEILKTFPRCTNYKISKKGKKFLKIIKEIELLTKLK